MKEWVKLMSLINEVNKELEVRYKSEDTYENNLMINALETIAYIIGRNPDKTVQNKDYITIADVFEKYEGTVEYTGIVKNMQEWFYGSLVKSAWCATSLCWCLAQLGLLKYTIGKKKRVYENVYHLTLALISGSCDYVEYPTELKRGDIVTLNFSGKFSPVSSKHITVVYKDYEGDGQIVCIGGNQGDKIQVSTYDARYIIHAFRPHYVMETVRKVELLPNA